MPSSRYRFRPADLESVAYFHVTSRVVDRRFILEAAEREELIKQMRRYEALGGLRVVTYCIMSNHFHILVEVPPHPVVDGGGPLFTEVEWLRHIERSLGTGKADAFRRLFEMYRGNGCEAVIAEVMASYEKRMFSVSCFMQNVKQAFSAWYNKRNGRQGTLWEEAFRSVLVEGAGPSLATMAAYIDLNPVRARMVEDPADYLWSGYGEAMASVADGAKARAGLAIVGRILGVEASESKESGGSDRLQELASWEVVAARYRLWLFGEGQEIYGSEVSPARAGFSVEEVEKVHAAGGKLSRGQMLRLKVNYFTRGGIFGSAGFINAVFESVRDRFGKNRKSGARKLKGVEAGDLRVLRDLQRGVG